MPVWMRSVYFEKDLIMIKMFAFGGLGNQMFQYAAASVVADRLNTGLCIDTSLLTTHTRNTTPRGYELTCFVLSENREKVRSSKWRGFLFLKAYPQIKNSFWGKFLAQTYALFEDKEAYNFDSGIMLLQNNALLWGYFQTEKYFSSHENRIREVFRFKRPLSGKNRELAEKIQSCPSVSIHIRRGDYITNKNCSDTFRLLPPDYYKKAIERMEKRVENPVFFVFSDEPERAKTEIDLPQAVYIDWNQGSDSYIDMQLMTYCRHNIIANSSFSWWGAWLNNHADKIVIAPAVWLKDEKANAGINDLLPEKWMQL